MKTLHAFYSAGIRLIFGVVIALPILHAAKAVAEEVEITGEIVEVDLSSMILDGPAKVNIRPAGRDIQTIAVPSMGRNLCAARERLAAPEEMRAGDLVLVRGTRSEDGAIIPCENAGHALFLMAIQSVPELGLRFAFRSEPGGYVLQTREAGDGPDFVFGVSLFSQDDLDALAGDAGPRDGPKGISLEVYNNREHLHAPVWVDRNAAVSSIGLATGPVEEAVLAGANAVRYRTDGLYQNEHIAAAHDCRIYFWTVMYDSPDDAIYRDFHDLLETFEFIPPE